MINRNPKAIIVSLLFLQCLALSSKGETREGLRAIIVQIQSLAKEGSANLQDKTRKMDLAQIQISEIQKLADSNRDWGIAQSVRADVAELEKAKETTRADKERAEKIQIGRERDVFVILFALTGALATVFAFVPMLNKY